MYFCVANHVGNVAFASHAGKRLSFCIKIQQKAEQPAFFL